MQQPITSKQPEDESLYNVKEVEKPSVTQLASYYVIPIVSALAFLGIVGVPVLGTINAINTKREDIDSKHVEIEALDVEISQLESLDIQSNVRNADLQKIDQIIPSQKSQVVAFVTEVESIAENESLDKFEQQSSENLEQTNEDEVSGGESTPVQPSGQVELVGLIAIRNTFSFRGTDRDIKDFLELLYNKSDLIIVESMLFEGPEGRLIRQESAQQAGTVLEFDPSLGDEWTIDVSFAKYLFSESFEANLQTQDVPLTRVPDEAILRLINSRY